MIKKKLNILFVASEVVPFAKTGGLADVSGALPKALGELGHNIIVVMPRYYQVDKSKLTHLEGALGVPMGPMGELWAGVYTSPLPNSDVPVYFIDYEEFFGRKELYNDDNEPFIDNDNRFIFLSKAALQLCKKLNFVPDVIHANDWHTASLPLLTQTRFWHDFRDVPTVLTVHNLQHQGNFYKGAMDVMESGWDHFDPTSFESFDSINMLKGGIAYADAVTTVSKRYAQEIQTQEFGFGLEHHIQAHSGKLFGILNGVDYDEWNPSVDTKIAQKFDVGNMNGKATCKRAMQEHFGLEVNDNIPLIGFVGRFAEQKGIGLISGILDGLMEQNIQIIMLGAGEKWAEHYFSEAASRHRGKFGIHVGYSDALAHQIEAGCDFFLMPSLFEPCGLNQIYSLRYGTLPIVRATGGLDDTIENFDENHENGNGFKFDLPTHEALYYTILWAVSIYNNDKKSFKAMQKHAMQMHFGWDDAAKSYEDVYRHTIANRRKH
ncbi:glycogen synthase GlgA [Candidatus Sulfurimonas baltica]|uniref:Glycogen synthase n=1 Tax=Candidatus Sulfurimonas baltica TaxID=2740404 RepID=A0A7S7LUP0_9BACT|nr:glycogen synthase GlgA [Candidatus Sulfurimonas baltica]QOY51797.1 glycogen synthase GlgA [Candidatus Sulfurimonas baltica]